MAGVIYHIERPTVRARWIVRHVLTNVLGLEAIEVFDLEEFRSSILPRLFYGRERVDGAFHISPSHELDRAAGHPDDPGTIAGADPMICPVESSDLPFDVFAASFYFLSRSEEYGSVGRDRHGRPVTAELFAARMGWLERPLVDEWCIMLGVAWSKQDRRVVIPVRKYRHVVTMDVDNGFKYLGREPWRSVGAGARDLLNGRLGLVKERLETIAGKRKDPYDVYDDLKAMTRTGVDRVILNFLVAPRGRNDHAVGLTSKLMRERIGQAAEWAEIGIHPSYNSSKINGTIERELESLQQVLGSPVTNSRQHFLRFDLPSTFTELENSGIREDHSMGFADAIGFRAGTCTPYKFYDLKNERGTDLTIVPFAVMDSAMAYKMNVSPDEVIQRSTALVKSVKDVGGTFSAVWHERFLSDHGTEQGWRRVIENMILEARP